MLNYKLSTIFHDLNSGFFFFYLNNILIKILYRENNTITIFGYNIFLESQKILLYIEPVYFFFLIHLNALL